jgi:hypothetical protein
MLKLLIVGVLALAGAPGQHDQRPDSREDKARKQRHGGYAELFAIPPIIVPGLEVVTLKIQPATPQLRHTEVFTPNRYAATTGPCNMPIVVGDATVDPGILIPTPHHGKHKIRTVAPKACGEKILVDGRRH